MLYATVEEFKSYVRIPDLDTLDDVEIERVLTVASRTIEHICSRTFPVAGPTPTVRYAGVRYSWTARRYLVPIDDLTDDTDLTVWAWDSVTTDYSTAVTGWELRPVNAPLDGRPWTSLLLPDDVSVPWGVEYPVMVSARWGWAEVPDGVVQATLLQASRVFKRRDSPFGVISSPDGSTNTRLLASVDPDVYASLQGLIKHWMAR